MSFNNNFKLNNKQQPSISRSANVSNLVSKFEDRGNDVFNNVDVDRSLKLGNKNQKEKMKLERRQKWVKRHKDAKSMYSTFPLGDLNSIASDVYGATEIVPVEVTADYRAVWDACIAYVVTALARSRNISAVTSVSSGSIVGTYYLAAVALFVTVYDMSVGHPGPIQSASRRLVETLQEVRPINIGVYGYTPSWPFTDVVAFVNSPSIPYHSFTNRSITTAPATGATNIWGAPLLETNKPILLQKDIYEDGVRAFEVVQRELLNNTNGGEVEIVNMTDGIIRQQTGAMFASLVDFGLQPQGTLLAMSEIILPHHDYALTALGWFTWNQQDFNGRSGWNTRTVRKSTSPWMSQIMADVFKLQVTPHEFLTHPIDAGITMFNDLMYLVSGDYEASEINLNEAVTSGFVSPSAQTLKTGEYVFGIMAALTSRFGVTSAMAAGDPLPGLNAFNIGAGTRFTPSFEVSGALGPQAGIEDLAGLSSFCDMRGCLHIPVLSTTGRILTVDLNSPGGDDLSWYWNQLYQETLPTVYKFETPGTSDLPPVYDTDYTSPVSMVIGEPVMKAVNALSGVWATLQGSQVIAEATGSRDGPVSMHLYLTHVLEPQEEGKYNLMCLRNVVSILSTQEMNPRFTASKLNRMMSVVSIQPEYEAAFSTIYKRSYRVPVGSHYAEMRSAVLVETSHRLSANLFAPNEVTAGFGQRIGQGGFAEDCFRVNIGGKPVWVSAAELLAQGIGGLISPDLGKAAKGLVGKVGHAIHNQFFKAGLHESHLAPVSSGHISLDSYLSKLADHQSYLVGGWSMHEINKGGRKKEVRQIHSVNKSTKTGKKMTAKNVIAPSDKKKPRRNKRLV